MVNALVPKMKQQVFQWRLVRVVLISLVAFARAKIGLFVGSNKRTGVLFLAARYESS